jgi:hypothetical protein
MAISTRSGDFFFLILLDRSYQWSQTGLFILGNSSAAIPILWITAIITTRIPTKFFVPSS